MALRPFLGSCVWEFRPNHRYSVGGQGKAGIWLPEIGNRSNTVLSSCFLQCLVRIQFSLSYEAVMNCLIWDFWKANYPCGKKQNNVSTIWLNQRHHMRGGSLRNERGHCGVEGWALDWGSSSCPATSCLCVLAQSLNLEFSSPVMTEWALAGRSWDSWWIVRRHC